MRTLVVLLVLVGAACAGRYHADIGRMRGHRISGFESSRPKSYATREFGVGQWVLTRKTVQRKETYILFGIVSSAPCGLWLHAWMGDEEQRALLKACVQVTKIGDVRAARIVHVEIKVNDKRWQVMGDRCDGSRCPMPIAFPISNDNRDAGGVVEDVVVPVGLFRGAKRVASNPYEGVWYHPEIPISGVLRHIRGRDETVVIGFGTTGAKELFDSLSK